MTETRPALPACCQCERCGYRAAGRKPICPRCGHVAITSLETTPDGKILDFVPVIYPPENLKELGKYVSVLVKLENGCNVFGMMLEEPGLVEVGHSVTISKFDERSQALFFRLK